MNEGLRLNDEHEDNKKVFTLKCFEHFQEIRRKIDLQREELKNEIDKVALAMIDRTKEFEVSFMKRLEPNKEITLEQTEDFKKQIDEAFREPETLLQLVTTPIANVQSENNEEIAPRTS